MNSSGKTIWMTVFIDPNLLLSMLSKGLQNHPPPHRDTMQSGMAFI